MAKASRHLNVSGMLTFLRQEDMAAVELILSWWGGGKVIEVTKWEYSGDGAWALHLNLEPLGQRGEEAYIPIPATKKPTVLEAVETLREMRISDG